MKKIIKKSTTITEMIGDNEGEKYIVNRKHEVNVFTEPLEEKYSFLSSENEADRVDKEIIKKDKYFREEIAKEAEEYKKKNLTSQTNEKLQTLKFLKESYQAEHDKLPETSNRKLRIADLIEAFEKVLQITNELEKN